MTTSELTDATNGWLTIKDILALARTSRSGYYKAVAEGRAPKPIRLSRRMSRWQKADVMEWLADPLAYAERNKDKGAAHAAGRS